MSSRKNRRELALRAIIQEAVTAWPQLDLDPAQAADTDLYISGADMLDWFCGWRKRAIDALYDRPTVPQATECASEIERLQAEVALWKVFASRLCLTPRSQRHRLAQGT